MTKDVPWNAGRIYIYNHKDYPVEVKFAIVGYQTWDNSHWHPAADHYLAQIVDEDCINYHLNDYWDIEEADEQLEVYGKIGL